MAITRQTGINLDSFLDFFQNKWLLCKSFFSINCVIEATIFSLTVFKFYQALFDWLVFTHG